MDQIQESKSAIGPATFYRFQVFQGKRNSQGQIERTKTVGMAYLKEGQSTYTLRLWTFIDDRFYILQCKDDPMKYFVMTREPNLRPDARSKYFWNIVGNARTDSAQGHLEIEFDLLGAPIFMKLFPEPSVHTAALSDPQFLDEAA
jgi:hypothetical protein